MQLISEPEKLSHLLCDLITKAAHIDIAVAWAGFGFDACKTLMQNRDKIRRMVVGIHFHQTDPAFIENFIGDYPKVRFVMLFDGTFHPKVYLFEFADGSWSCILGSANFTNAALEKNEEVSVRIDSGDASSEELRKELAARMKVWSKLKRMTEADLPAYREAWNVHQRSLKQASNPVNAPLCKMTWEQFLSQVQNEPDDNGKPRIEQRLSVIREIQALFRRYKDFDKIPVEGRKKVAGYAGICDGVEFDLFGNMKNAGRFHHEILQGNRTLSEALDQISLQGKVTHKHYLGFVEKFKDSLPKGGGGIGTASRLLAMKRPDYFICVMRTNRRFCDNLGTRKIVNLDNYWDAVIAPIQESVWWKTERPADPQQKEIWDARTALLDALYYNSWKKQHEAEKLKAWK